jgi:hypothetical protein
MTVIAYCAFRAVEVLSQPFGEQRLLHAKDPGQFSRGKAAKGLHEMQETFGKQVSFIGTHETYRSFDLYSVYD